ncbi:hypothetical protein JXL83_08585 [candidate division WOR-3 bacterium]|nr:hypothetical protein [candidate division WOR-3 bacterium]
MNWRKYPSVIELHTKIWLDNLSVENGYKVNFDNFPEKELEKIRESHFDGLWLMGIWKRSTEAKKMALNCKNLISAGKKLLESFDPEKDLDASAYSICDYVIDERFGSTEGFLNFRNNIEPKKIILDFVPNHTSRDCVWLREKPEIYMAADESLLMENAAFMIDGRAVAMGKDPNFPAWNDTAQLDYSKSVTRETMIGTLKNISGLCDGLRCDMAMLVTNDVFSKTWKKKIEISEEFWSKAINEIKKIKNDFLFIAEVYWGMEWDLQQQGFDYTYDKTLYDRLRYGENSSVYGHLHAEKIYYEKLVRFLENHDEDRSAALFENRRLYAAAILTFLLPGMRLFFDGQFQGRKIKSPIQFTRWPEETIDTAVSDFYKNLLSLLSDDTLHSGKWTLLNAFLPDEPEFSGVFSFMWSLKECDVIAVVNNTPFHKNGFSKIERIYSSGNTITFKDVFTDKVWDREKESILSSGLYFDLEPYEYKIYRIS